MQYLETPIKKKHNMTWIELKYKALFQSLKKFEKIQSFKIIIVFKIVFWNSKSSQK